jgi:hypothetical protein
LKNGWKAENKNGSNYRLLLCAGGVRSIASGFLQSERGMQMGLLPGKRDDERIGNQWVKEKQIPRHILNRRADRKLDYVADLYGMAMGERLKRRTSELHNKTLYCEGFHYLKHLNIGYTYENRFWSFAYNLYHKTVIDSMPGLPETNYCRFIVKNIGKLGITDAVWLDGGSQCSEEELDEYLKLLNNKLIIDRIVSLDMTHVEVVYQPAKKSWAISNRTLVGSTTWILIPPVMHLIKLKPEECVKMLEFFELVADAVVNRKVIS